MSEIDALTRLRDLPEVFTLTGLCRITNIGEQAAPVYLNRWKAKGLIEPAGERLGIYFNLLKCPEVTSSHRIQALEYEYPSAILCGASVLHALGWITQIPTKISVAIQNRRTYRQIYGFDLMPRPIAWYQAVHEITHNLVEPEPIYGLRTLPPSVALADLYGDKGAWHPDIDDLDIPDEELSDLALAFQKLGIPVPEQLANGCLMTLVAAESSKPSPRRHKPRF